MQAVLALEALEQAVSAPEAEKDGAEAEETWAEVFMADSAQTLPTHTLPKTYPLERRQGLEKPLPWQRLIPWNTKKVTVSVTLNSEMAL